jgi:hypothetical protein
MKPIFDIAGLRIALGKIGGLAPIIKDFTSIVCRTSEIEKETIEKLNELSKTYSADYYIFAERGDVVIKFYPKS